VYFDIEYVIVSQLGGCKIINAMYKKKKNFYIFFFKEWSRPDLPRKNIIALVLFSYTSQPFHKLIEFDMKD